MKIRTAGLFCFSVMFTCVTDVFSTTATHDEPYSGVIAEKFGIASGGKNILTDAIINQILNIYAPVTNGFDNDLCRNHGKFYKDAVKIGESWALKMFDSSSKIPDGILAGNLIQLGNFDECVQIEDVPSDFGSFSGQHCLVSMSLPQANLRQRTERKKIIELSADFLSPIKRADFIEKSEGEVGVGDLGLPFRWSLCVPSSCQPRDLQLHLQTALPGKLAVKVTDLDCSSRAFDNPFSSADWFAVGFMAFFGLLVVLSTSYDLIHLKSESRKPVLAAFSVYTNSVKLMSSPTASPDNLPCLHGVRFLSMAWVVLGHQYIFAAYAPSINQLVLIDYVQSWSHIFITNGTISVDSFLLLSGVLVCYIFMKEMERGANFNLFLYYIHRYIRLTPPYAVVILLTATLFRYMGEGPFFKEAAESSSFPCQDKWWIGLLYVNNYVRPLEQCVAPAWYIAVDMQLFWLSPLVLFPLLKWPKLGKILLGVLIGVGLLISFLVAYLNEIPGTSPSGGDQGTEQYYPVHTRFTPWLIGIGLGYILHTTKNKRIVLSRSIVALGWILSFGLMLTTCLLAHRFFQFDHQYERVFESIYTCLMRPGWVLGLAWLIFACVKGYGGFINTFLSWSVFQILGRLTYSVYLIHYTILIWDYGSIKNSIYLSDRTIFFQYFGDMVIVFAAAFALSVVFEAPAIILERHFLGGLNKKERRPAKAGEDNENNTLHGEKNEKSTASIA